MMPRRLFIFLSVLVAAVTLRAQNPLAADSVLVRAGTIAASYAPWQSVEMTGRLFTDKLPVKVGVKIFMLRDSRLMISFSAPFIGEAGRIEITGDSITAVNRMKRVYAKESLAALQRRVPVSLSDVQDLLLGRVFKAGTGTLSPEIAGEFEWFDNDGDTLILVAEETLGVVYDFLTGPDGILYAASVVSEGSDARFDVDYLWAGQEKTIDFSLLLGATPRQVRLQLGEPKWNASPFASFVPGDRYRQVDLIDFAKSF